MIQPRNPTLPLTHHTLQKKKIWFSKHFFCFRASWYLSEIWGRLNCSVAMNLNWNKIWITGFNRPKLAIECLMPSSCLISQIILVIIWFVGYLSTLFLVKQSLRRLVTMSLNQSKPAFQVSCPWDCSIIDLTLSSGLVLSSVLIK